MRSSAPTVVFFVFLLASPWLIFAKPSCPNCDCDNDSQNCPLKVHAHSYNYTDVYCAHADYIATLATPFTIIGDDNDDFQVYVFDQDSFDLYEEIGSHNTAYAAVSSVEGENSEGYYTSRTGAYFSDHPNKLYFVMECHNKLKSCNFKYDILAHIKCWPKDAFNKKNCNDPQVQTFCKLNTFGCPADYQMLQDGPICSCTRTGSNPNIMPCVLCSQCSAFIQS